MKTEGLNFFLRQSLVSSSFDIDDVHIKNVEAAIRKSYEYREYLANKKEINEENKCDLLKDFDYGFKKKHHKVVTLELHHYITLYNIVEYAYKYLLDKGNKNISTFEVAQLVIDWHYYNYIPYIFLSTTVHQAVHAGQYNLEPSHIKGDYKKLYELINKYVSADDARLFQSLGCA